jgi:hypothetical protein
MWARRHRGIMCAGVLAGTLAACVSATGAGTRSHPRLLADSADVLRARQWIQDSPWYRSIVEEHRAAIEQFISRRPIYVSPVKQTYQYKMYSCPTHDVELLYEELSPFVHRCPQDTSEHFSGGKYDAAWSGWYNRELGSRLVWLGILYQLYQDDRYAEAGREILMRFAELYLKYPTANTILGPAHVFFGTLSESFWGVDMTYGYDLLYDYGGFSEDDRTILKERLFMPLAEITQQFPESASNRQLWYNNVSAAVGFLYDDQDLIDFALRGTYGFQWQLGSALPESGFWPEWSGYHFVALRGMIHLAEMARHNGLDLYHRAIAGRSMKAMFDAPFEIILPNYEFPRLKDSGGGNLLEYAAFYEVGYAVYGDRRYLALLYRTANARGTQVVGETSGLGRSRSPVSMFQLVPDLTPATLPLYPERSVNLEGNGFAVLRTGSGDDRRYLSLDYGIMGGEHGHPDRLQIGYFARGRNWIVDPLNESYFNPNLQLWYRQTIAHNAPVIDQTSQQWANGEPLFFGSLENLQVAAGMSREIYPGTTIKRTVLQIGEYFLDLVDVGSPESRILDWPLHGSGTVKVEGLALAPEDETLFGPEPGIPGYDQLSEIFSGTTDSSWTAVFTRPDGEHLAVVAIGEPGTRVFRAMTPPLGGFYKQMVADQSPIPMILSRRLARATRFAHLVTAYGEGPVPLTLTREQGGDTYRIERPGLVDEIGTDVDHGRFWLLRKEQDTPVLVSAFNASSVLDGNRVLISSPRVLRSVECRWRESVLEVETEDPLFGVRLAAGGVHSLTVNGIPVPFQIEGEFLIPAHDTEPFLEVLSPKDSSFIAGATQTLALRIWNPGDDTVRHVLRIRPSEDWSERVQSQLDWWGGVVNLLPLHKGSVQRRLSPEAFRLDASAFPRGGEQIEVEPGTSRTVQLSVSLAAETPPVKHRLVLSYGPARVVKDFSVHPPFRARVFVPTATSGLLRVELESERDTMQKVLVSVLECPGWDLGAQTDSTVSLAPGASARADFPGTFLGPWRPSQHYPVRVTLSAGGYSELIERDLYVTVATPVESPPSLDGSWEGWPQAFAATIDSVNQISKLLLGNQPWRGPEDFSARVRVLYDRTYLYVGAEVSDDSVVTQWDFPAMSYPWDTDCMEVVLDMRQNAAQGDDPPTPGLFRHLSMAGHRTTAFPAERWRGGGAGGPLLPAVLLVPGAETFFGTTPRGYALICRYPLSSLPGVLPRPGWTMGFDVAFSDNDGTTYRKNQHIWAGYGQNQSWWDMGTIGVLIFGE